MLPYHYWSLGGVCLRIVHLYAACVIILPDEEALELGFAG